MKFVLVILALLLNATHAIAAIDAHEQLVETLKSHPEQGVIQEVNMFFNETIEYVSDQEQFNVKDYWATPLETLNNNKGDCEDIAIAKLFTLEKLGVEKSKLKLVYVMIKQDEVEIAHMVLVYHDIASDQWFVLDNTTDSILPLDSRTDLNPVFSFNKESLWVGVSDVKSKKSATERLGLWKELLLKI